MLPLALMPGRPAFVTGINANGSIHFGPDDMLYLTLGDYDYGTAPGPGGAPFALDLKTPIGKLLRLNADGSAPPDNPFTSTPNADHRVYARGFQKPFNFAFRPQTGGIYGTDNTASCEELNIVKGGANYGWPDVGEFPSSDCSFGDQVDAIHFFSTEDKAPGQFLSPVHVSGLKFVAGAVYNTLGDSLLACESDTHLLRRLVLQSPSFDSVTSADVVVKDCQLDVATSPDGIVYYSNEKEIRRLVPPPKETS